MEAAVHGVPAAPARQGAQADDPDWLSMFAALRAFVAAYRGLPLRTAVLVDGRAIGRWVYAQRLSFVQQSLAPARCAALETVPGWVWNRAETAWRVAYASVATYIAEHQGLLPTAHGCYRLSVWAAAQRAAYKIQVLPTHRALMLEALPGWTWGCHDVWMSTYEAVAAYAARHGKLPDGTDIQHRDLHRWVACQCVAYRNQRLTQSRIAALGALPGWAWTANAVGWHSGYASVVEYMAACPGRTLPTRTAVHAGFKVGEWVDRQRQSHKAGNILPSRAALLEAIPGWTWSPSEAAWLDMYAALKSYIAEGGTLAALVCKTVYAGRNLGRWCRYQQIRYHDRALSLRRVRSLEAVPGWTWAAAPGPDGPAATAEWWWDLLPVDHPLPGDLPDDIPDDLPADLPDDLLDVWRHVQPAPKKRKLG